MSDARVNLVLPAGAELAESPVWQSGRLSWVDTPCGAVHTTDVDTGLDHVVSFDDLTIAAIMPLDGSGAWVAATSVGFAVIRGDAIEAAGTPYVPSSHFLNDAKRDRLGRVWSSVNTVAGTPGAASLFVWEPGTAARHVDDGYTLANGLGWSPDDRTMYVVDSLSRRVYAYDYDLGGGRVTNRRVLCAPAEPGMPDGLAVDAEGCVWIAFYAGGAVRRFDPEGTEMERICLPVSRPTSCAFGAAGDLYVTSAREGLDERALAAEPMAGAIWVLDAGVAGTPVGPCR